MSANIGSGGVRLRGIPQEDFMFTMLLDASIVEADIGKPVAMGTVANTAILATTGSLILGRLTTFEDRTVEGIKVGTIETKGCFDFPILAADTVAIGDSVVGGASATVKKGTDTRNRVVNIVGVSPDAVATVLIM